MSKQWKWELADADGQHSGVVSAVDPRDALSRMFTSEEGMKLAQKHGITPHILDEAPGNEDTSLDLQHANILIHLEQESCIPAPSCM